MSTFFDITTPSNNCDPCGNINTNVTLPQNTHCDPCGNLNTNVTLPQNTCYNPCPHAHPLDGGSAWSSYISAANSIAWVGKMPQWNGSEFIPVSGSSGTVTSVGLALPSEFNVTNSPVTSSGTLTGGWVTQNQNLVFSSPNGSSGTPSFRALVAGDIPLLNYQDPISLTTIGSSGAATFISNILNIPDYSSSLSGYVPYTGATGNLDMGNHAVNASSFKVNGTNGNGHIHFKHQASNATGQANSTTLFADSDGNFKYKNDSLYYVTFSTHTNTANRVYTFPDRNITIDNITTSTTSNGTGFIKSNGTNITFDNSTYLTTAITSLNGLTAATQTFANDTNVTITSATSTHTLGWSGTLSGTRGGTGVNNGSNTITIAGNLAFTGAFNTTFAQQITGTFTLPPVAGTIAASAVALTSGRVPYVTTSGMLTDSSNLTWDDTNKRLFGTNDIAFGKSTSYNISFVGTTTTITAANNLQINNSLTANGIYFFSTNYHFLQSTRSCINNYTSVVSSGVFGGSLSTRQSADYSFTSGEATYTAGGGTTITAATGSWNTSGTVKSIGVGDRVSLSNAPSTYVNVTSVTSNTVFTVNTAIGAAGTLTLNVKPANFRVFSNANVLQFLVNDLGYVGIGIAAPTAWLHLVGSTTAAASLNIPSGTAPTSPNNGDLWFDGTNIKMRIGGVTKTFTLI